MKSLKYKFYSKTKRFLDIGLCSFALVTMSPLFIATAIAIKISSPGTVFYYSDRAGKDGKPFHFYKFRSMHPTSCDKKLFVIDEDRIFTVGRLIRRLKIDELPQLINVIKGDMSIVGPRPMPVSSVDTIYCGKYEEVLSVKPGLTSAASLFDYTVGDTYTDNDAYSKEILPVKQELELYYVRNNNLKYDAQLVLRTMKTILQVFAHSKNIETQPELEIIKNTADGIDYSKYRILIFGAGGRQALPIMKGFSELGCEVTAYCNSKLATGYLTKYKDRVVFYDKENTSESFENYGIRLVKTGYYDLVVPLGDGTATLLSKNKKELEKYAKIAVNDWDIFQFAIDKHKTMKVCEENGVFAPKTLSYDNPVEEIKSKGLRYPVVIKPYTSCGSVGFNIIDTENSLKKFLESYDNSYGQVMIQEYVQQGNSDQYRADFFRDRDGIFRMAIVGKVTRWYPLDAGSGIHVESIYNNEIIENCEKLLNAINWNGYANIDMVFDESEGVAKILEINGRTGASILLDYISGINVSKLILENEMNLKVSDMTKYKAGCEISCLMPDMLWFIKSPNRFKSNPSWFKRWNIKDVIFSFDDPIPSFGFVVDSFKSYKSSMAKRRRYNG